MRYVKYILSVYIVLIPFIEIYKSGFLASLIDTGYDNNKWVAYIDESIACVLLVLLIVCALLNKTTYQFRLIPKKALVAFVFLGLYSGIYNYNSILRTILGIADLLKYFIILLGFTMFCRCNEAVLKKVINCLYIIGAIASIMAIIDEAFLLIQKTDLLIQFYPETTNIVRFVRGQIWGAISIFGHHNGLGYFQAVLTTILIAELMTRSKPRSVSFCLLFLLFLIGLILSTSRSSIFAVIISSISLFTVRFYAGHAVVRRKTVASYVFILFGVFLAAFYLANSIEAETKALFEDQESTLRTMAAANALTIVTKSPLLGVGPGSYGGSVSFKLPSPIYENIYFPPKIFEFAEKIQSLDSFYSQIFAEYGIIGAFVFLWFIFSLSSHLKKQAMLSFNNGNKTVAAFRFATSGLFVSFYFLFMGGTLNSPLYGLLTCAIAGAALGAKFKIKCVYSTVSAT
ncbi:O-antigen ligase family protein [Geobacter pelophilus]|uniref:O-antigen ligase family protein n=1 Tax=Geoanaerobacter pelophilus TaxID=60036 RepID=A0AAW4KWN6_9BACT|nr:O-antigen ligase family protein [Geoanaerobacter pelophilus]MBT0663018.1 O-antigen ligase family protein [Geoanaerobacter pelophilus]